MSDITSSTSLAELAALVSTALESRGIRATLSGGGAVSIYTENQYQSYDLDFISSASVEAIGDAVQTLGFSRIPGAREFHHPNTRYFIEFPSGPLAFGETTVADRDATTLFTEFGSIRIITPTQSVMDRLAAYVHWGDLQSYDQAVMVCCNHAVNWDDLQRWSRGEGMRIEILARLKELSESR